MIRIAPSILSADFSKLGNECLNVLDGGADWIHYDVMDGVFVPNITIGMPVLRSLAKAVDAYYDVHLMIADPAPYVTQFADAGAKMITFHVEATSDVRRTLQLIHDKGIAAGIAVKPYTPLDQVLPYVEQCDMVLQMTVEPGFGGQKFKPDTMEKLSAIRRYADSIGRQDLILEVDGGIDPETVKLAAGYGADCFVAGSSVFGKPDRAAAIKGIRENAEEYYRKSI